MDKKLQQYRNQVRNRKIKDKIQDFFTWKPNPGDTGSSSKTDMSHTIHINTSEDYTDDIQPLLSDPESPEGTQSPIASSDNESDDIGSDKNSLYSKFTKTTFVVMSVVLWFVVFMVFVQIEFGIVYLIVSAIVGIYINTRTRPKAPGEISAYSVFNKNCERIEGTVTAEQLQSNMLMGPLSFLR